MSRGGGRAANGRSTVYQDKHGRWHGFVSMGITDAGKPARRHVGGRTRSEVTAKVAELEKERERNAYRPSPNQQLTVGAWLEEWLVIIQRTRKPKTFDTYTSLIRNHCTRLRERPLNRLTVRELDNLFFTIASRSPQRGLLHDQVTLGVRRPGWPVWR